MDFFTQWVKIWSLSDKAREEKLNEKNFLSKQIKQLERDHLIDQLLKQKMTLNDQELESAAEKYYNSHLDSFKYIEISIFETDDQSLADKFNSLFSEKKDFFFALKELKIDNEQIKHKVISQKDVTGGPEYYVQALKQPVLTANGPFKHKNSTSWFHVLKIETVSYENVKKELMQRISRILGRQAVSAKLDQMKSRYNVNVNKEMLKKGSDIFLEKYKGVIIADLGFDSITLEYLNEKISKLPLKDSKEIKSSQNLLMDYIDKTVNTMLLHKAAIEEKIDETDAYKYAISKIKDRLLAGEFIKYTESLFKADEPEIRKFYNSNLNLFKDESKTIDFEQAKDRVVFYMKKDFLDKKLTDIIALWQQKNKVYLNRQLLNSADFETQK
jgi:hypothetical protein